MERINALLSGMDNSVPLTDADKAFVRKTYKNTLGKELNTKSGCKDCWKDALIEIICFKSERKYQMFAGALISVNGVPYGKHNITDGIAEAYLKENPNETTKFYVYDTTIFD